ncbi:hypothetical protein V5E97_35525 [Singulisphaera sp. Ch08]|uniref:DUF5666 domain-containing protein n=1 Tax=Singulisphaera sp. Ch08 TaxID=3120278 RepID=A0AAU7CDP1_9BACT
MRKVLAVVAACGLGIALASGVWAQDNKAANGDQNQEKDKARGETITVRGVIAEVNAEGELAIDYQTKQAVLVAATYLTIVETPKDGQGDASKRGDADRKDEGKDKDKDQAKDGDEDDDTSRRNVYIVWLSPRTKVYEASGDSEEAGQKKEAPPDRIDVGEVVEVQMTRRAETAAEPGVDQSGPARRKHGRYRVVLGDAKEITILSLATEDEPSSRK